MSLPSLTRPSLFIALALLVIGIGSIALSIERPLTAAQWANWQASGVPPRADFSGIDEPQSRTWDYQTYLAAVSATNRAKGPCGFVSMNGSVCALGGFAAPLNWLGLAFLMIGVGAFYRHRTSTTYVCPHA